MLTQTNYPDVNESPTFQQPLLSEFCESNLSYRQDNTAAAFSGNADGCLQCVAEWMPTSRRTGTASNSTSGDVKGLEGSLAASQTDTSLRLADSEVRCMEVQHLLDRESAVTTQDLPKLVRHAADLISRLCKIAFRGALGGTEQMTITHISGQLVQTLLAILQYKTNSEDTISCDNQSLGMEAELAPFAEVMKSNTELRRLYVETKSELDALKCKIAQNAPREQCSPTTCAPSLNNWNQVNESQQHVGMKQHSAENIGEYMDEELDGPDTFTDEQALQLRQPHFESTSHYSSSLESLMPASEEDSWQDYDPEIRVVELEREIARLRGVLDVERRANDCVQPTYKAGMADVRWNEPSLRRPSSCVSPRTVVPPATLLTGLSSVSSPLRTSPISVSSHGCDARLDKDQTFSAFVSKQWQAWVVTYCFVWCLMMHGLHVPSPHRGMSFLRIILPDCDCRGKRKKPMVPWDELLKIAVHVIIFIAIQAWIACYRERQIWFQANGLTRKYLLGLARAGPSWLPNFGLGLMPSPEVSTMLCVMLLNSGRAIAPVESPRL